MCRARTSCSVRCVVCRYAMPAACTLQHVTPQWVVRASPRPRKDSGSARSQHRPHCIRARAPSKSVNAVALWRSAVDVACAPLSISIAALCRLGSPPAAGFGRLAAVHSTNPVAALYPYSACATWDDSGDQRLRVGWLVGWYARTVPSSVRLQKRYLVGTKNIEYN